MSGSIRTCVCVCEKKRIVFIVFRNSSLKCTAYQRLPSFCHHCFFSVFFFIYKEIRRAKNRFKNLLLMRDRKISKWKRETDNEDEMIEIAAAKQANRSYFAAGFFLFLSFSFSCLISFIFSSKTTEAPLFVTSEKSDYSRSTRIRSNI